jgi:hypothetical protein
MHPRINAWKPERSSVAPEIAWSLNSWTTVQPWRAANSRQMRSWSVIEASR